MKDQHLSRRQFVTSAALVSAAGAVLLDMESSHAAQRGKTLGKYGKTLKDVSA